MLGLFPVFVHTYHKDGEQPKLEGLFLLDVLMSLGDFIPVNFTSHDHHAGE